MKLVYLEYLRHVAVQELWNALFALSSVSFQLTLQSFHNVPVEKYITRSSTQNL